MLREFRPSDADAMAAPFAADPGFGSLIGFEEDPTAEWFREQPDDPMGRVIAGEADEPWGYVNLHKHDERHRRVEVGIWLVPQAQGRGAGTEALRQACDRGFAELGVIRVQLTTLPDNEPMVRCAEKVGFQKEGVLRAYTFERGKPVDNLMMAVLRGELR